MGADELVENGHQVGVIEYHSGDVYQTDESGARLNSYGVSAFPTSFFDGVIMHEGGNATTSLYPTFVSYYDQRIDKISLFTLDAQVENVGNTNWKINVQTEMVYPYSGNSVKLMAVLTESHIPQNWFNQTEVNFVCRDMIPDQNGTGIDFNANPSHTLSLDFEVPATYDISHCEIVLFLQDTETKEILQANKAMLVTGLNPAFDQINVSVYPVPTQNELFISSESTIESIRIVNNLGQVVFESIKKDKNFRISTEDFLPGVYFLNIETQQGRSTRKIIKH
jgi:hypothetical protein